MGENDWTTPGSGAPRPPGWSGQQPPRWAQPASAGPAGAPPGAGAPPPHGGWSPPPPWVTPRAPKPGIIPLRPLGLGEILDGAVGAMRSHPRATLGTSALVATVLSLLVLPFVWLLDQSPDIGAATAYGLLANLVSMAAWLVLVGFLTIVVSRAVLGQPVQTREAWVALRRRLGSLLAVMVLLFLIVVGVLVAGALPGLVALALGAAGDLVGLLFGLGIAAGAVAMVYLMVSLSLAVPAAVLEAQPARRALARSRRLVKGGWWRVFGINLLAGLIVNVVTGIVTLPLALAGLAGGILAADSETTFTLTSVGANMLASIVSSALTYPFLAAVQTLLYVDRRMRREGLDIQLARAANPPETPGTAAAPGPLPQW